VQVVSDALRCPWQRTCLTPARSSPVIGTYLGFLSDSWLDETPVKRRAAASGFQHDRRASLARARDVQSVSSDIKQLAWSRMLLAVLGRCDRFVSSAHSRYRDNNSDDANQNAQYPTRHGSPPRGAFSEC